MQETIQQMTQTNGMKESLGNTAVENNSENPIHLCIIYSAFMSGLLGKLEPILTDGGVHLGWVQYISQG